jgi:hypothetical protein
MHWSLSFGEAGRLTAPKEKATMKMKILLPALLLSVAVAAPASANWFHNPFLGINRNVGSAPNPTPDDVRQMRLPIIVRENNSPGLFNVIGAWLRGERLQTQAANTPQR